MTTDPDFGTDGIAIYGGAADGEACTVLDAADRGGWPGPLGRVVTGAIVHRSEPEVARVDVFGDADARRLGIGRWRTRGGAAGSGHGA